MENALNPHEPVFTIGTIAKMLNVAVQTIRLYEHEGLILPAKTVKYHRHKKINVAYTLLGV